MAQMPAMTAAYASANAEQMGDATTLVNIAQRVGGAIGAAGLVIVLAQTRGTASSGTYTWAFAALAGISTLTLFSAAILRQRSRVQTQQLSTGAKRPPRPGA